MTRSLLPHTALVIAGTVIAFNCSCARGPKGLSNNGYISVQKALSAMRRANEYRDAGVLLFEPRLLEAERKADAIVINNSADDGAAELARICVKDSFPLYRKAREQYLDYLENRSPSPSAERAGLQGWAAAREHARVSLWKQDDYTRKKTFDDAGQLLDGCLVTLGGYM
jgi:hypothetical protein